MLHNATTRSCLSVEKIIHYVVQRCPSQTHANDHMPGGAGAKICLAADRQDSGWLAESFAYWGVICHWFVCHDLHPDLWRKSSPWVS